MKRADRFSRLPVAAAVVLCLASPAGSAADPATANDMLDAELWMQTAVEYRANCLAVYALAKLRLDEALADKNWTAYGQTAGYPNLPPAVILDLDETALDNAPYEASLVVDNTSFNAKSWDAWVGAARAKAIPGAVDFTRYAAAKNVKVFYVSNRNADQREPTKRNLRALGFPLDGDGETLLLRRDRPEWAGAAKGQRYASIAKDYRVLLIFGDQFGDFTDDYGGGTVERDKVFDSLMAHFGHDWMVLANPVYGSFESAAYGHDGKLSQAEKRTRKVGALLPWPPP